MPNHLATNPPKPHNPSSSSNHRNSNSTMANRSASQILKIALKFQTKVEFRL